MTFVARLKRWHGLSRLKKRVRQSPAPNSYAELAERLIAVREEDDALRVAEEGLAVYPDSDRLRHARLYVLKGRLGGRIRHLRDEAARRPHPNAFAQLAQCYRDLGSDDEALAVAAEGAERFPEHESGHLAQGEIRFARFRRDRIARDAVIAEKSLRTVLRIAPQHASAHARLAELYWLVGLPAACRSHLGEVLAVTPGAGGLEEFAAELDGLPPPAAAPETFAVLAERVQSNGAFANDPGSFPQCSQDRSAGTAVVDAGRTRDAMDALAGRPGLRNAAIWPAAGEPLAEVSAEGGLPRADFGRLVAGMRDVSDDATRRMDMGGFLRAHVEGPSGSVVVTRTRGFTVALCYAEPMRSDAALALVLDFTANQLGAGAEAARA